MRKPFQPATAKVLAFDVFGTAADGHGDIRREGQNLRPGVDGDAFAITAQPGC